MSRALMARIDIYGKKDNVRKHNQLSRFNPRAPNLFTISDKETHRQRRRDIAKGFSTPSMKAFETRIVFHITRFCSQVDSTPRIAGTRWSQPLKMSQWGGYLILDTLTDFLLNRSYNLVGSAEHRLITHHMKSHLLRLAVCSYVPLLAVLKIDKLLFRDATKSTRGFWRWVKTAIIERSQQIGTHEDLFSRIQKARQFDPSGIQSEMGMFIAAGETVS